jgi:excinuclease UvrABC nuclease subunit
LRRRTLALAGVCALNHIQDVSLIKDEYRKPKITLGVTRIEAYDMAHLRGSANVGVMTVVEDGEAQKNDYRKFKSARQRPAMTSARCAKCSRAGLGTMSGRCRASLR